MSNSHLYLLAKTVNTRRDKFEFRRRANRKKSRRDHCKLEVKR